MGNVKGADAFIKAVNAKGMVANDVTGVVRKKSADIKSQAQRLAPVRTGHLKRSASFQVKASGTKVVGTINMDAMNRNFNYGYAQEHGTRYISGKHFLETAFDANKEDFEQQIRKVVTKK